MGLMPTARHAEGVSRLAWTHGFWRRLLTAFALVVLLGACAGAARAGAAVPSGNLLQNPGAEDGACSSSSDANSPSQTVPIPGWTTTSSFVVVCYSSNVTLDPSTADTIGGGSAYFMGGVDSSTTATQTVDVSSAATDIDAGGVQANLSGYLGGYSTQEDNMVVLAEFLSGAGQPLGTMTIGPVTAADRNNQSALVPRSATAAVPKNTRSILVQMNATRSYGTDNDAAADNLSLTLSSVSPSTLTVSSTNGTVTSSPAGIDCGSTCSAQFPKGTTVTLTATPAAGYLFEGWSGACSGGGTCTVSMSADASVQAVFAPVVDYTTQPSVHAYYVVLTANFTAPAYGESYTAWFDYGPDTGYGQETDRASIPLLQYGQSASVSQTILVAPGTNYHFRLHLRSNFSEDFVGVDRALTTPAPPSPNACTTGFTSLSGGYSYQLCGAPDLDQVRKDQLTNNGEMFCVPTSTVDLMAYLAQKTPGLPPGSHDWTDPANFQLGSQQIAKMGSDMSTDGRNGTTGGGMASGIDTWLKDAGQAGQGLIYGNISPDSNGTLPIDDLALGAQQGGLVLVNIGFFDADGNRTGGHEVFMTGLRGIWDTDNATLDINDPYTAALVDDVQSTPSADELTLKMGKVGQQTLPIVDGYSYPWIAPIEAIDGFTVIGSEQVAAASPGKIVLRTLRQLVPGTPVEQTIVVPGSPVAVAQPAATGTIDYLTSSLAHAAAEQPRDRAAAGSALGGALVEVDLRTHRSRVLARGLHSPHALLIAGPGQSRYVLDGRGISIYDAAGRQRGRRTLADAAHAGFAWDAARQVLGVVQPATHRLLLLNSALRPVLSRTLSARSLPARRRADLGFAPSGAAIIHPEGTRSFSIVSMPAVKHRAAIAAAAPAKTTTQMLPVVPSGFTVDSAGRILITLAGKVYAYNLAGHRISGPLSGRMPTATNLAVLRSASTLTPAQARLPLDLSISNAAARQTQVTLGP